MVGAPAETYSNPLFIGYKQKAKPTVQATAKPYNNSEPGQNSGQKI
jgi:hypothetical protein